MSTIELKNKLHSLIDSISDSERLQAMLTFINSNSSTDWWDELDSEQKASIEEGLNDIKNGNVHSDEEVRGSVRKRILEARG